MGGKYWQGRVWVECKPNTNRAFTRLSPPRSLNSAGSFRRLNQVNGPGVIGAFEVPQHYQLSMDPIKFEIDNEAGLCRRMTSARSALVWEFVTRYIVRLLEILEHNSVGLKC